jgi:hypothetical protein
VLRLLNTPRLRALLLAVGSIKLGVLQLGRPEEEPLPAACCSLLLLLLLTELLLWPMRTGLGVLGTTTPISLAMMSDLLVQKGYLRAARSLVAQDTGAGVSTVGDREYFEAMLPIMPYGDTSKCLLDT